MAKFKVGDKVRVAQSVPSIPAGTMGSIASVHDNGDGIGAHYGLGGGGYIGYAPEGSLMESAEDDGGDGMDGDGDDADDESDVATSLQKLSSEQLRALLAE